MIPAIATEPSKAYTGGTFGPSLYATVVSSPFCERTIDSPKIYLLNLMWMMINYFEFYINTRIPFV